MNAFAPFPDGARGNRRWRRGAPRGLRLALIAALALAVGCQETVEPGGTGSRPPVASDPGFIPAAAAIQVIRDDHRDFRVIEGVRDDLRLRWYRSGESQAIGPRYRFFPRRLGPDTLTVMYAYDDGRSGSRTWLVAVVPDATARIDFQPPGTAAELFETQVTTFAAATPWPLDGIAWRLDGAAVGQNSLYEFSAATAGTYTLAATAQIGDSTFDHAWSILVRPLAAGRPPLVTDIRLAPGDAPGRAVLSWARTDSSVFPLTDYAVRYSFEGPLTEATWATAPDPGGYPWVANQLRHSVTYTPENAGLEADREVWFAIRARDDRGLLSPLGESVHLRLPGEWWIEGLVAAPDGTPLTGIDVGDQEHRYVVRSGTDGTYRLGPYFELTRVVLEAGTPPDVPAGTGWHTARSDTLLAAGARRQDFRLIPRHGSEPDCFVFGSNFLWYLRTMTLTRNPTFMRPDVRLHHWQEYPVPVYVPAWVSPAGVDYGAACRDAVAIWNASLSSPILRLEDDPAAARIAFTYDLDDGINYGLTTVDQPGDGAYTIGDVAPEHVTLAIVPSMASAQPVTETAMHELGHSLGLHGHARCIKIPYLMNVTARGTLDDGPENAIHPDERRAVEVIRALPPGWDMSVYPLEVP